MAYDLSKARKEAGQLRRERYRMEEELLRYLSRKKLIAGTAVKKYKACNRGNCRCIRGELHGPTYYISRKEGKKTKMIYIRRALWPEIEEKIRWYRKWRNARARIVKINQKILVILDKMEGAVTVDVAKKQ
jgi:hypothetical protein